MPFDGCTAGINHTRFVRRIQDTAAFRRHVSSHMAGGFVPSPIWLVKNDSQLCPRCSRAIVSLAVRGCIDCNSVASLEVLPIDVVTAEPDLISSDDSETDSGSDSDHDGKFEVKRILDQRKVGKVTEYLVAWKRYSADENSWEPAKNLVGAKEAIAKFRASHQKSRAEKEPKAPPLSVPRATGIPPLQRNHVVQVNLGISRSAMDALLPAILPSILPSGPCEAKQSTMATTPDSFLQMGAGCVGLGERASVSPAPSPPSPSLLPVCVPSEQKGSARADTLRCTKEGNTRAAGVESVQVVEGKEEGGRGVRESKDGRERDNNSRPLKLGPGLVGKRGAQTSAAPSRDQTPLR